MNSLNNIRLSMLDLVAVREGGTVGEALQLSLANARHVEALAFTRYWLAEHHNMPGIASSATAVLVGHIAGGTQRIRVGSGGIMLPNHAPLVVAEAFGTLAELYPGRIDLGLGRRRVPMPSPCAPCVATASKQKPISPRGGRTAASARPATAGQPVVAVPGGDGSADLAARLQPVLGPPGSRARLALCLRLAFRAGHAAPGHRHLSPQFPAFRPP
jgi:hypothetical protein